MLNLEAFRATKKAMSRDEFCEHIGIDSDMLEFERILAYGVNSEFYIEETSNDGEYYLILARDEYVSRDLARLEEMLFEYASHEGPDVYGMESE